MKRSAIILFLILLAAFDVSAETLLRYENRVARAAEQISRIKSDTEYEELGIEDIQTLMPRREQVEQDGKKLAVDNSWLYAALDAYSAEHDPQKKKAKLDEIGDRLTALDEALIRAAETSSDQGSSQDARTKIRNILDRSQYRAKEESRLGLFIKKIYDKVVGFLSDLLEAFQRMLGKLFGSAAQGSIVSTILVFAATGIFLFFIVRLALQFKPSRKSARKRTVLGEEIEAGTTPGDLFEGAMAAARNGDFRVAVRKLYISLLYELSERNLVELEDSATNREYLAKLMRFDALIAPMGYMTDRFDVAWYGMLPATQEEFSVFLARYNEAMQRAKTLTPEAVK